jgi:hypothetical protein
MPTPGFGLCLRSSVVLLGDKIVLVEAIEISDVLELDRVEGGSAFFVRSR